MSEQDSLARKGPSPELGNADASGHPSPMRPGERSTGVEQPDRSSPESLPPVASGGALNAEQVQEAYELCGHISFKEKFYKAMAAKLNESLAAHDQKVREQAMLQGQLEIARKWHSLTKHKAGTYECCRLVTALEREQATLASRAEEKP